MNIELADNSKCIPKGIVRDLLIKIDKFILPIDFIILDVLEDFRMPIILGRPLLTIAHAKIDVFKRSISLEVGNEKVIFKLRNDLHDMKSESVLMIQSNIITEEDELMNIESDLFTYNTNTCESCHILAVDTDLFTYEIERKNHTGAPRFIDKIMEFEKYGHHATHQTKSVTEEVYAIMKFDVIRKVRTITTAVDYDDNNDFYDPDRCGEGRNNEIRERVINNLHDEWFKGTSDDEDDIEGIIDYLEPTSYDGFIDLDEEEYNKRRCRLLGMPYIAPPPLIIEQVEITRYSLGPGEVYTKVEVLNMEELPRTRNNIATIRIDIMDEVYETYVDDIT
ncbi:hypothetical protein Tco_0845581 [Tanacetum coccineum]